jgi:hypothetical protein
MTTKDLHQRHTELSASIPALSRVTGTQIPTKGDQVEQRRIGVTRRGSVWYADQLQALVKWEDGRSSSLRLGRDQFAIRTPAEEDARSLNGKAAEENRAHSLAARVAAS